MNKTIRVKGFEDLGKLPFGHELIVKASTVPAMADNNGTQVCVGTSIQVDVTCTCENLKREHSFRQEFSSPRDLENAMTQNLKEHAQELGGLTPCLTT